MCASLTAGASAVPALTVDSQTVSPGQDVLLTVSMNAEVQGLHGLMLKLRFDSVSPSTAPKLSLVGLNRSRLSAPFAGDSTLYGSSSPKDPRTGLALTEQRNIAIVDPEGVNGPTEVIRLPFKVPAAAPPGAVYTVNVNPVANDADGRKLEVAEATATLTVEGLKRGDVDGNGSVQVGDAVTALRAAIRLVTLSSAEAGRADVNRNSQVEVGDAVIILRIVTGLE